MVPMDACPNPAKVLRLVLDACLGGLGGADRSGKTIFDIEEKVPRSCLSACRQILLDFSTSKSSGKISGSVLMRRDDDSKGSSSGSVVSSRRGDDDDAAGSHNSRHKHVMHGGGTDLHRTLTSDGGASRSLLHTMSSMSSRDNFRSASAASGATSWSNYRPQSSTK